MILTTEDVKGFCRVLEVIKEDKEGDFVMRSVRGVQSSLARIMPTVAVAKKKSSI